MQFCYLKIVYIGKDASLYVFVPGQTKVFGG